MKLHAQSILKISLVFAAIILILPAMGAVAEEGVCNITDLVVDKSGRTEIIGDKELDYRFFPLPNPERLVFDFKNARLKYNDGYLAELKPDSDALNKVRISQFSLNPDIVRLVVETAGDDPARISRSDEGCRLIVDFGEVITKVAEPDKPARVEEPEVEVVAEVEEPVEIAEPEVTEKEPAETIVPVQSKPQPIPFKVTRVDDGIAVDVRGVSRDKVYVTKKFRPRRVIIETGDISDKTAPRPMGKIDIASGPVSNYETFGYEGGSYRLVLNIDKNSDYREEALPDGVRVVIYEDIDNPIRVLSSSDETEIMDGDFSFEVGTDEKIGGALEEYGEALESVIIEVEAETGEVHASIKPIPVDMQPMMVPFGPMGGHRPRHGDLGGMDYNLVVGDMAVVHTMGLERVSIGNPAVVSVNVISQEEVLITALAEGQSAVMTWETNGMKQVRWVEVKANVDLPTRTLTELIGEPCITANIVGESVILEGTVDTDVDQSRALAIAATFGTTVINLIEVLDPKQVMVKVRMVEIDKKSIDDYFKQVSAGARADNGDFTFSIVSAILDPEIPGGGLVDSSVRPGIVNGNMDDIRFDPIDIALDYLETERKANILSEPNLLALHGSEARFRVGGEIPYTYQNQDGVNVVEFKEFGVELNMTPIINSNDSVRLKLNPIVRTVDFSLAIGGIPGFRTREMTTDVQLHDGETMILGGLIQNEVSKSIAKVPFLGDLPILGELFRSEKFQNDTTELLVFITPVVLNGSEDLHEFITGGRMGPEEVEGLFEE